MRSKLPWLPYKAINCPCGPMILANIFFDHIIEKSVWDLNIRCSRKVINMICATSYIILEVHVLVFHISRTMSLLSLSVSKRLKKCVIHIWIDILSSFKIEILAFTMSPMWELVFVFISASSASQLISTICMGLVHLKCKKKYIGHTLLSYFLYICQRCQKD